MSESFSQHLLDLSPLPTLLLNHDLVITYSNKAAQKLFGGEINGIAFDQFTTPMPLPRILFESTGANLNVDTGAEIRQLARSDGSVFTASVIQEKISETEMAVFVRNISEPVDYWGKLHQQKRTEDELTRSTLLQNGDFQAALYEIAARSADTLQVERVNIWLIDDGFSAIRSIMNYDRENNKVLENVILSREDLPQYFQLLESEDIVITIDSEHDEQTRELAEGYIRKFNIKSMLDVPVRVAGKMIGLICYEELTRIRNWDVSEQKFALTIAQLLAQALETHRRREAQIKLEETLAEKQLLLREVNHRVRNNFNLISDMIRLKKGEVKDEHHAKLFEDLQARIASLNQLHRQLYQSDNISQINFRNFLIDMAGSMKLLAFREDAILTTQIDNCVLPLSKAMLCAVIINELMLNCAQHAFSPEQKPFTQLILEKRGSIITVTVKDNGTWQPNSREGTGLKLVEELSERLSAKLEMKTDEGTEFNLTFTA
ncbi:MAG: GAF domain-containing protein [Bacteroidia bacterium]|jgi:two-component sensor histidine kinase|nr:GAF domain-containing protein [Bacteroidia bacterium]